MNAPAGRVGFLDRVNLQSDETLGGFGIDQMGSGDPVDPGANRRTHTFDSKVRPLAATVGRLGRGVQFERVEACRTETVIDGRILEQATEYG